LTRVGRAIERDGDHLLARRLEQAGLRDVPVDDYRARVALTTMGTAAAGAVIGGLLLRSTPATLLLVLAGTIVGASPGRARLDHAIAGRRERIRLELVTVNQLLAMHVRSGAGPIQATQRLVARGHGAVIEELDHVLTLVRGGTGESAAFRRAAELTPEPAAARTYRLFATAAERGVDLADGLRALSEDLRAARP